MLFFHGLLIVLLVIWQRIRLGPPGVIGVVGAILPFLVSEKVLELPRVAFRLGKGSSRRFKRRKPWHATLLAVP